MTSATFLQFQHSNVRRIEAALDELLPNERLLPTQLHTAMRYSTLAGGKRIRALLVYATGELLKITPSTLDPIACAVELIHAYSLIHDDLPAMDDDDLRRGKASCHRAFDEATAILAGDALQALAFTSLTQLNTSSDQAIACIETLSNASGSEGMVGGQAIDLISTNTQLSLEQLENMHELKTGALISASVTMVAQLQFDKTSNQYQQLEKFARCIGLAFQVQDDILDETATTESLGKTQGKDKQASKPTYLSLMGLEKSQQLASNLYKEAVHCLAKFDEHTDNLRDIAKFTVARSV
ncbi:MAG: geranyl transferase [Cycloclasticus sp. symbiont of Poecilosclerida sp. M]|nr:MAG: geranyl transferase [Cycloclasticus sp. symbiont of Poecilosclerida sp. M]